MDNITQIKRRKKVAALATNIFRYFFLISIGYIVMFQLFYILTYAFRDAADLTDASIVWLSKNVSLQHIKDAAKVMQYGKSVFNTVSIQLISGVLEVFTCAIPAYGLARYDFFGKKFLFVMVLLTIVVPTQMIAVPMYLNYARFDIFGIFGVLGKLIGRMLKPNLLDSGLVFYLPSIFGVGLRSGLFIFIYRQFFKGLPKELEEAAAIDGAGPLQTFLRVVIPSSRVDILTVFIFSVVWHWNEYYYSVLYFEDNYPLAVQLSLLNTSASIGGLDDNRGLTMAGCLIFILPVLIMYAFLQKQFIKSIDRIGIVG